MSIPPGTYPGSPDRPVIYPGLAGKSWLSASELSWLVERLPETGLFVEVGTASGATAARVADARPRLDVLCVDTFADSDEPHVAEHEPGRPINWVRNRRPNMHLFVGTLEELGRLAPDLVAVAVLVDGDHSEGGVASDLWAAAAGPLRLGGTIYVHDLQEDDHPGVSRAVEAFCRSSGARPDGQHWTLGALRLP